MSLPRDITNNVVGPYLNDTDYLCRLTVLSADSRKAFQSIKWVVARPVSIEFARAHPSATFGVIMLYIGQLDSLLNSLSPDDPISRCHKLVVGFSRCARPYVYAERIGRIFRSLPSNITCLQLDDGWISSIEYACIPPHVTKLFLIWMCIDSWYGEPNTTVTELNITRETGNLISQFPNATKLSIYGPVNIHRFSKFRGYNLFVEQVYHNAAIFDRYELGEVKKAIASLKSLTFGTWDRNLLDPKWFPLDLPFYVGQQRINIEQEIVAQNEDRIIYQGPVVDYGNEEACEQQTKRQRTEW